MREAEAQRHLPGTLEEVPARMRLWVQGSRPPALKPGLAGVIPHGRYHGAILRLGCGGPELLTVRSPIPRPGCWAWGMEAPSPPLSLHPVLCPPLHKEPLQGQVPALRDPLGGPGTEPRV